MQIAPRTPATVAATLAMALPVVLPAAVGASVGGASPSDAAVTGGVSPRVVTAAGGGVRVATRPVILLSQRLRFGGHAAAGHAGDIVEIQRHDPKHGWLNTTHAKVKRDGTFAASWR